MAPPRPSCNTCTSTRSAHLTACLVLSSSECAAPRARTQSPPHPRRMAPHDMPCRHTGMSACSVKRADRPCLMRRRQGRTAAAAAGGDQARLTTVTHEAMPPTRAWCVIRGGHGAMGAMKRTTCSTCRRTWQLRRGSWYWLKSKRGGGHEPQTGYVVVGALTHHRCTVHLTATVLRGSSLRRPPLPRFGTRRGQQLYHGWLRRRPRRVAAPRSWQRSGNSDVSSAHG